VEPISPLPQKSEDEFAQGASEQELAAYEAQKIDVEQNRTVAAVSYLYPLAVVSLFTRRDSRFAQFHARQGAVLFCLALIAFVFPFWLRVTVELVIFAGVAYGFVRAAQGKWARVPLVALLLEGRAADTGAARAADAGFVGATGLVKRVLQLFHKEQGPPERREVPVGDSTSEPPASP
jgi:uncharacterized membrane protein